MTRPLLEVVDVTRRFAGHPRWLRLLSGAVGREDKDVLRGVSFRADEGERLSIVGANGIGKTTLLEIIVGLLQPTSGAVFIDGMNMAAGPRRPPGTTSYVPADERSFPWRLTPRQNLEFFAGLCGLRGWRARHRIEWLLEHLALQPYAEQPFGQLSSGTRQRLAIARALLVPPRVLLLDEPTRSLDVQQSTNVWEAVSEEMARVGGTTVFVTHQLDDAVTQADRILILNHGVIARDLRPAELSMSHLGGEGLTVSVQELSPRALDALRRLDGVRDVRSAPAASGEQVLDIWADPGALSAERCILELTRQGAVITSLRRGTPLQALLQRLEDTPSATEPARQEVRA